MLYGDGDDRDALTVTVSGAHEGGVLAVSHVERQGDSDGELERSLFVSGGSGTERAAQCVARGERYDVTNTGTTSGQDSLRALLCCRRGRRTPTGERDLPGSGSRWTVDPCTACCSL